MTQCPCGSGKALVDCCGPLISGEPAKTAEALMRSRYTAFTLDDLEYIHKTCAGEALLRFDRSELAASLPSTTWLGLRITDVQGGQEADDTGFVTFSVSFRENARLYTQSERSEFRRVGRAWRYVGGEAALQSPPAPGVRPGRNDPCSCGSGKKYKKCCGA